MKKTYTIAALALVSMTVMNNYGWSFSDIKNELKGKVDRFIEDPKASLERGSGKITEYAETASAQTEQAGKIAGQLKDKLAKK